MRHHLLRLALVCGIAVCSSVSAQPWDGPFGLEMGLTLDQLRAAIPDLEKVTESGHFFKKAPKPYSEANGYMAIISEDSGVCRVGATTTVQDSDFGDKVKEKFKDIQADIERKYGEPTDSYDFLKVGSLWSEPNDWMAGLYKGDRVLASTWEKGSGPLSGDIQSIVLDVKSKSPGTAFIHINYVFTNHDLCVEEDKKRRSEAL